MIPAASPRAARELGAGPSASEACLQAEVSFSEAYWVSSFSSFFLFFSKIYFFLNFYVFICILWCMYISEYCIHAHKGQSGHEVPWKWC